MALGIESVRVRPSRLEFARPYATARGTISHRDLLGFEVVASDGTIGRGETASLSLRGGPVPEAIAAELSGLGSQCLSGLGNDALGPLGDRDRAEATVAAIVERCRSEGLGNEALCALDLALFDLAGKLSGEPVWRLLGADRAEPVRCNATLVAGEPALIAADAAAWAADGFTTFKIKAGLPGDVEAVEAVRATLGADASIRIDANACWDAETAIERLAAMGGPNGLELAEQPCAGLEELARVKADSGLPIAADESVVDPSTAAKAMEAGAVDLATVKLAEVGGICAALAIGEHLPVYVSSALDGPAGIAAAAHLVQALRARGADAGLAHGLATERLFGEWPGGGALLAGAELHVPDGPGLG